MNKVGKLLNRGRKVAVGAVRGAADEVRGDTGEPVEEHDAPTERETSHGRNVAEWTTLLISFAVVFATVSLALFEHFAREEPPGTWLTVELDLEQVVRRDALYYLPYTVRNDGSDAAEAVGIIFTVRAGATVLEEATTEIPFLANSGTADGVFVTSYDPASHTIEARPSILQIP
jgi:uncharacterized protein (TIGR02588 family)